MHNQFEKVCIWRAQLVKKENRIIENYLTQLANKKVKNIINYVIIFINKLLQRDRKEPKDKNKSQIWTLLETLNLAGKMTF